MGVKVKLKDILDAQAFQTEEIYSYLEKNSGVVWDIPADVFHAVEEEDMDSIGSYYEDSDLEISKKIIDSPDDFIDLSGMLDMDDYSMMQDFCHSIEDDKIRDITLWAIRGPGAFRRFKELIRNYDLIDKWYHYRDDRMKKEVLMWFENEEIEGIELVDE